MSSSFFHEAAIAGAGTGKTYSLVENYLCALLGFDDSLQKKRPQEIVALTFTEKAANEMRLRIARRLSGLLTENSPDQALVNLSLHYGRPLPDKEEIRRILRAIPNAYIATFHSFCSQLLRREADACGIDEQFNVLSAQEEKNLARNILRPIIITQVKENNRAIKSLVARMGLSANLQSLGLIDSFLEIYFKLFEKNIDPRTLLHITQTRSLSQGQLLSCFHEVETVWHSFSKVSVSDKTSLKLERIGCWIADLFRAISEENELTIIAKFKQLKNEISGNFANRQLRSELVAKIATLGARIVDRLVHQDEVMTAGLLLQFHDAFMNYKRQACVMSYSDLLLFTKEALRTNLTLRKKVKRRIRHILVDEYQDTSPIQQDIVSLLAENRDRESPVDDQDIINKIDLINGPSLFVVGDKKQSIYGFRGANVELFENLVDKMELTHRETKYFSKHHLTTNRRSQQRIIDVVNLVAFHTMSNQGYRYEHQLKSLPEKTAGKCALWVNAVDKNVDKTTANLNGAAYGVVHLLKNGDRKASDIVILVRRIKSASAIKRKLGAFGVAAKVVGGDGFFQQQEVVDLLSAFRLINNPLDQLACSVVFRSPLVLLCDQDIMKIALNADQQMTLLSARKLIDASVLDDESQLKINNFIAALTQVSTCALTNGLAAALDLLIERLDLAYRYGLYDNAQQKWANIEKLRVLFARVKTNPFTAVDDFYQQIFQSSKEPQANSVNNGDEVTIMTIHQAKGLEFPVVVLADGESIVKANFGDFLVDKDEGLAMRPSKPIATCLIKTEGNLQSLTPYERIRRSLYQQEEWELARLLYVALTRAQEELYVASSLEGLEYGRPQKSLNGQFLTPYYHATREFLAICDVTMLPMPEAISGNTQIILPSDICAFSPVGQGFRWFASAFNIDNSSVASLIGKNVMSAFSGIDGNLAHNLLATCSTAIWQHTSEKAIDLFLNAAVRAQGKDLDDVATIAAVKATMSVLRSNLPRVYKAIAEKPLICAPVADVVIEGFADLVVECDDFVAVIEFKSSKQKVLDVNTYMQVLSYAHALAEHTTKPVKFGVLLVGSTSLSLINYDEHAKEIFLNAVSSIAHYDAVLNSPKEI